MTQRLEFASALALVALVGCGSVAPKADVSGTVTLDGKAIGPGSIAFVSADGKTAFQGAVNADGSYRLESGPKAGLTAGKYTATVSIHELPANVKPGDRPPPGKSLIPEKYELSATSGLQYEVVPGSNTIDVALTSE